MEKILLSGENFKALRFFALAKTYLISQLSYLSPSLAFRKMTYPNHRFFRVSFTLLFICKIVLSQLFQSINHSKMMIYIKGHSVGYE